MNDPLSPVVRGEVLDLRADTWNAVMDATRQVLRPERPDRAAVPRLPVGVVEAFALNSTGAALREHKPATVTAAGGYDLTDTYAAGHWQRKPLLTLGVPGAATDFVVVTLEAIPDGGIGRVAVSGLALCDVHVNSAGHAYAAPTTNTDALESAASGSVRLLYTGTGGSTRRCAVYLHEGAGGAECHPYPIEPPTLVSDGTDIVGIRQRWVDCDGNVTCRMTGIEVCEEFDPEPPEPEFAYGEITGSVVEMPSATPVVGRTVSATGGTSGNTNGSGNYTIPDVPAYISPITVTLSTAGGEAPSYSVNGGTWYAGSSVTFDVAAGDTWAAIVDWRIYASGLNPDPVEDDGEGGGDPP